MDPNLATPTESLRRGYELSQRSSVSFDLSPWGKINVSGPDAKEWLQGQVTQDLAPAAAGSLLRAALLTPTGQMVADLALGFDDTSVWVFCEPSLRRQVLTRLSSFLVTEDVLLDDRSATDPLFWTIGPSASGTFASRSEAMALLEPMPNESFPETSSLFEILRLERGVPLSLRDYGERTLAMELGDAFVADRISFNKGCYVGQEIVHRIHARGHTNRKWIGLRLESPVLAGAPVLFEENAVGQVTSATISPRFGPIAGAMIQASCAASGTEVSVGGVFAKVTDFPFLQL